MTPQPLDSVNGLQSLTTSYVKGLHIVANFNVADKSRLTDADSFKSFADRIITKFRLIKVGEVYHTFPNGGFTGVVCLTESHLSIHTWPELNYLTFDVFLSNYLRDNSSTTHAFYNAVRDFFNAEISFEQFINR